MANTTATGIKNSWSLIAFAKQFGKPKLAKCANHDTGEEFKCVAFGEGDKMTFVSFSPKIGDSHLRRLPHRRMTFRLWNAQPRQEGQCSHSARKVQTHGRTLTLASNKQLRAGEILLSFL